MRRLINWKQSKNNYFVDTDGNKILDLNAGQAGATLGYNNDDMLCARMGTTFDRFAANKVNLSAMPANDMADLIRENVMIAAPKGLLQVHLGGGSTGAEANELAMSVAFKKFAAQHGITDMSTVCGLGFENALHGTTTATLSVSSTEANPHGLPAFPWPKAEFPQLKYPLSQHEAENREEENRCLKGVKDIIDGKRAEGGHVGCIIIEPMSGLAQQMATPNFYRKLRALAKAEGIPFIVDETKTGIGASGKNWAYEYWYLSEDNAPDFVTFGGARASGLSGFYSTMDYRLNEEATSYQQNVDMTALLNYGLTWKIAASDDLLHKQKDTSSFLKIELDRMSQETGLFSTVRGYGTHLAFDCATSETADSMQRWLFRSGINVLKCGP